jgi:transcriptional regulator with XRE-family HTH domain
MRKKNCPHYEDIKINEAITTDEESFISTNDFGLWKTTRLNSKYSENESMRKTRKEKRDERPFAKILTRLLKERGLTLTQASTKSDVPMATLSGWKNGQSPEDFIAVQKLAHALGVSLSFLLTGVDDTPSKHTPSITEVFEDGGELFDGFAKITITKLIPKKKQ